MWKPFLFIFLASFALGGIPPVVAKEAQTPTLDLSGTWNFQTSDHKSYGICEKGKDYTGTLTITQTGDKVKLVFNSGPILCSPPAACAYEGKIKGNQVYFHNASVAQGGRGTMLKSIHLKLDSPTSASGKSRDIKNFIGGSMCEWTSQIKLNKTSK
ncbi:MAG: hypothetical protein R3257_02770 [bacterium]|nr:hypothetical protein [bacterium]